MVVGEIAKAEQEKNEDDEEDGELDDFVLAVLPEAAGAALAGTAADGGYRGFRVSGGEEAEPAIAATVGELASFGAGAVAGFGLAG